jgi:hypothetical protein
MKGSSETAILRCRAQIGRRLAQAGGQRLLAWRRGNAPLTATLSAMGIVGASKIEMSPGAQNRDYTRLAADNGERGRHGQTRGDGLNCILAEVEQRI